MSFAPLHLLIVEPDAALAHKIATLALACMPSDQTTILARAGGAAEARALLERLAHADAGPLIVVCSSRLPHGRNGLDLVELARVRHPRALALVITNGERDELVRALTRGAQSVLARPLATDALRATLRFLAAEARHLGSAPLHVRHEERADGSAHLRETVAALEVALDAVESARFTLERAPTAGEPESLAALREAERLAVKAHRRVLDARRMMRDRAAIAQPARSASETS